ncbi:MAG: gamma-glutamyltransferase [Methylococcales bacterium]|nr:gamma-glutamyltransferase [Methylococcales bacterium]MBT7443029.1 gamma-glutamyltransferase [Methylococcales bacterium]
MTKSWIFGLFLCVQTAWADKLPAYAIASAHPLATEAGLNILNSGGNAFDAAVTVSAVLAVVEPQGSGIGGGGFWLLHEADKKRSIMLDGRERAPLRATATLYQDEHGKVIKGASKNGPLAAGIPGLPAALVHLSEHYGKLPLKTTLAPAINLARHGFPVNSQLVAGVKARLSVLKQYPASSDQFLSKGSVPKEGMILIQEDLAKTLQLLASKGHAGFYDGEVASKLVSAVQKNGGIWHLQDLKQYQVVERAPIVGHFKGKTVVSAAPPSSGGVVLIAMLNIIELLPEISPHTIVEVMKLAYKDRAKWLGDPDYVVMPIERLLSGEQARLYAEQVNVNVASQSTPITEHKPKGEDTTHFSILDEAGNAVSATLSVNYRMGSGFVAQGTGVLLNNEMDDFSSKPGHANLYGLVGSTANAIAPGKRMLSSMSPTFVYSEDSFAAIGTPGGSRIITMVLHAVLAHLKGEPVEQWVSSRRYHHQYLPDEIQMEQGTLTASEQISLIKKGQHIKIMNRDYGNMQVILWDKMKQAVTAASDPRGKGMARVIAVD